MIWRHFANRECIFIEIQNQIDEEGSFIAERPKPVEAEIPEPEIIEETVAEEPPEEIPVVEVAPEPEVEEKEEEKPVAKEEPKPAGEKAPEEPQKVEEKACCQRFRSFYS